MPDRSSPLHFRMLAMWAPMSKMVIPLGERFQKEKKAWNIFYDLLDKVEEGLERGDPFALDLKEKAKELIKTSEIDLGMVI